MNSQRKVGTAPLRQALQFQASGRFELARQLLIQIINSDPTNIEGLNALGILYAQCNNLKAASRLFGQAVAIDAKNIDANANLARAQAQLGMLAEAARRYDLVLALDPKHKGALEGSGGVLSALERNEEALERFNRLLKLAPKHAATAFNRGVVLHKMKRFAEASEAFALAARGNPNDVEVHYSRAAALNEIKQHLEALKCCDRATKLNPNCTEAHFNRANALSHLERPEPALEAINCAIELNPTFAPAYNNRATILMKLGAPSEAMTNCDIALRLHPGLAAAYRNRSAILFAKGDLHAALKAVDKSLALNPDDGEAHLLRANILGILNRYREACEALDAAQALGLDLGRAGRLKLQRNFCDWAEFGSRTDELVRHVANDGSKCVEPFLLAGLPTSTETQLTNARKITRYFDDVYDPTRRIRSVVRRDRIRLGYFSGDLYDHAVAVLMAGVFEHHDRSRFEITAFALNPPLAVEDDMRKRLIPAFDRFIDVFSRADDEIAKLSRDIGIDIAIDLNGHTQYSRTGIFARRAAPIQVNYLGFPGTMGVPFLDYIVADSIIIPNDARRFYVEKVVYMPHSYQPRDDKQPISSEQSRADYGLPENAFVFCCFNNLNKVLPDTFHLWMRILARVENSVIWLQSDVDEAITNLRREAGASGIDPQRLIFAPRMPNADHLAAIIQPASRRVEKMQFERAVAVGLSPHGRASPSPVVD